MQCPQCKAQIPDDSVFCHECGAKVERPQQPPAAPSGGPTSGAAPVAAPMRAEAAPEAPRSRYAGAALVSGTLSILGWLIAIAGFILAIALASQDDFDGEEIDGAARVGLFVGTLIFSWLMAVSVLWSAYVLRLLSDIEGRLSGRSK